MSQFRIFGQRPQNRRTSDTDNRSRSKWSSLLHPFKRHEKRTSRGYNVQNYHQTLSKKQQKRLSWQKDTEKNIARKPESLEPQEKKYASLPEDSLEAKEHYGDLSFTNIAEDKQYEFIEMSRLTDNLLDRPVGVSGRLHAIRRMGLKLVFFTFRQQAFTVQGVLCQSDRVSPKMMHWASHLNSGDIVYVRGVLRRPKQHIRGCSMMDKEIWIEKLHVLVHREERLPFSVYEAEICPEKARPFSGHCTLITDYARLQNRILDLRTQTSQAIFRIQAGIGSIFRSALERRGFIEIHTPKLQVGATESGSSVFAVKYFDRQAFLAQSPQLAKQMAISADFERVYEIGAVFRAENSNTHRHLTEYTGLDIEMAIKIHYHEMLRVIDEVLKEIFSRLYRDYRQDIDIVRSQYSSTDLIWLDETPILKFSDAVQLLTSSGWRDENGRELKSDEDLSTRDEIRLGQLVKKKYGADYYILDKFPRSVRPFYTMPDSDDQCVTNSFDVFVRGQEIITGGQRIHDYRTLKESMRQNRIDIADMEEYLEAFRLAAPPHAGAGVGLERLLMLFLDLKNIRFASLFYRDPKSFPVRPKTIQLRHPAASTLRTISPGVEVTDIEELQPVEDLIANYGDSTSTNWLDSRYRIWRDNTTGAAIAYIVSRQHVIIPGNPLCDTCQYNEVTRRFLIWLHQSMKLKPIWILLSSSMEEILCGNPGWQSISCIAENRISPSANLISSARGEVAKKIQHAKGAGVRVMEIHQQRNNKMLEVEINQQIARWLSGRYGTQIHLSQIQPWVDRQHRRYFYALGRDGVVCALVVLAVLAPSNGMQIKYSLDFPGAPSGTIEYILTHAIQEASKSGIDVLTFGAGATDHLTAGHLAKNTKLYLLQHAYTALAREFQLANKTEFRMKLGAYEDPLFIAFPPHSLGPSGVRDLVQFFKS